MFDGRTKVYGVMGWPVTHSASPAMHNAAFAALGINAVYAPFSVPAGSAAEAVRAIRALGICGMNVTVPHKRDVIPELDGLAGEAAALNSVNVIVRGEDGGLTGHNTDVEGFRRALEEAGIAAAGARVLMFGAGGAAPAVARALQLAGTCEVTIVNRTLEKAVEIAAALAKPGFAVCALGIEKAAEMSFELYENIGIIINATSLGLKPGEMPPVLPDALGGGAAVVDIIYNPWRTDLLKLAENRGARAVNGYGMLLHQAAEAFRLWTGCEPPLDVMREAGEKAVGSRE